jgi:uncharacterized protein YdeI (BOF family)
VSSVLSSRYRDVLTLGGRLNRKLKEDEVQFQDEGGLLLPPTIEQKISSTGTITEQNTDATFFFCLLTCIRQKVSGPQAG